MQLFCLSFGYMSRSGSQKETRSTWEHEDDATNNHKAALIQQIYKQELLHSLMGK